MNCFRLTTQELKITVGSISFYLKVLFGIGRHLPVCESPSAPNRTNFVAVSTFMGWHPKFFVLRNPSLKEGLVVPLLSEGWADHAVGKIGGKRSCASALGPGANHSRGKQHPVYVCPVHAVIIHYKLNECIWEVAFNIFYLTLKYKTIFNKIYALPQSLFENVCQAHSMGHWIRMHSKCWSQW